MPETLKPCPLCGKPIRTGDFSVQHWFLFCECGLEFAPDGIRTREELIEVWNRRPSGWISVKDWLPEERKRVLFGRWQTVILGDYKKTGFSIFPMRLEDGALIDDMGDVEPITDYTHWMPLPSAPEASNES